MTDVKADYMRPGEQSDGISNLILFYNGHYESGAGKWNKDKFIPYISYLDSEQRPVEWFFDGGLFLAKWSAEFHGFEESEKPTDKRDWEWYLNKSFAAEGDLAELNKAVTEVGEALNDRDYQMKVVMMIPYPAPNQGNFGEIAGEGALCFDHSVIPADEAHGNKMKAIRWYIGELLRRWNQSGYSRLRLDGLYWMNEAIHSTVPGEEEVVRFTAGLVHETGLKFFWIPYFNASMYWKWKELGFDAAVLQPNHFFSNTDASRIKVTADMAQQAGMGVEIEVDYRVFESEGAYREKYLNYLNGGIDYGYAGDVLKGYYQDVDLLASAARSSEPSRREIYQFPSRVLPLLQAAR